MLISYIFSVVLLFFNFWNWYIAISGKTTIEYLGMQLNPKDPRVNLYHY
jgi:hypothetical protein